MATKYCFTVNGMRRTTTEKKSLLRYLRDDLHLFSVKDGCSEGACGTCTIIVDGVAVKACVLTTDKSVGRNIVTVEGLTEREQDAFVYALKEENSTVSDREHSVSMCERKCLDTANIQTILLWMVWYIYLQYAANTLVQEC